VDYKKPERASAGPFYLKIKKSARTDWVRADRAGRSDDYFSWFLGFRRSCQKMTASKASANRMQARIMTASWKLRLLTAQSNWSWIVAIETGPLEQISRKKIAIAGVITYLI
jgi:hypothetical protein